MSAETPRAVDDLDAVLALGHPVLTDDIGAGFSPPAIVLGALDDGGAVAVQRRSDRGHPGLAVIGSPPAVRALLSDQRVRDLVERRALTHVSVPRDAFGHVADLPLTSWTEQLAVNLTAPAVLSRELLPHLRESRGTVVFVNSSAGLSASTPARCSTCMAVRGACTCRRSTRASPRSCRT